MKYKLIAFDLDGTLAPSGKTLGEREQILQMMSRQECAKRQREFNYLPYTQVEETIKKLSKEVKLAIISNGNGNLQRNKLFILKMEHHFKRILISEELCKEIYGVEEKRTEIEKPQSTMFEKLCQEENVQPKECLYVGNRDSDSMGAKNAGWDFIRVVDHDGRNKVKIRDQIKIDKDEFMKILRHV